ncbi:DUF7344 domain-containing protein [Halobaculum limi]|uniref:DUF7344 domain-containing protein n=1 Tax=Halobaculum limi TaxID=3031916 RepID=UPI0024051B5A|nr:hypothetical protein [Halobaculum sp. YSMS11]
MSGPALTVDDLYDVLSDWHRRRLLWQLLDGGPSGGLDVPAELPTRDETERTARVQFHHVHLPKLEACALVEFDEAENLLTRGPMFDRTEPLLSVLREREHQTPLPEAT